MADAPRQLGKAGPAVIALVVTLLTGFEGLRTTAWHDPIDPPGVNTICYGHIEGVEVGDKATKVQCVAMLKEDIPRYVSMVQKCINVPLPPHRYAAIISFTYNLGQGALCKSSVAKKLNAGDIRGGCDALLLYNKSTGVVRKGLVKRREAERTLCLMED